MSYVIATATIENNEGNKDKIRQVETNKPKRQVRREITEVAKRKGKILKISVRNYSKKPKWLN